MEDFPERHPWLVQNAVADAVRNAVAAAVEELDGEEAEERKVKRGLIRGILFRGQR